MPEQIATEIYPLGDHGLIVRFAGKVEPDTIGRIRSLYKRVASKNYLGLIELVPAQNALAVYYDPLIGGYELWRSRLLELLATDTEPAELEHQRIIEIPVCYGGEFGPDLEFVAKKSGLTVDEVITRHSQADYTVSMIGFVPGFPYLVGLPESIAMPRRSEPRLTVPAGSVGIGGSQTGIYPSAIPGGWQLIGRTPVRLFNPDAIPPCLLIQGDKVRFTPISPERYAQLENSALQEREAK